MSPKSSEGDGQRIRTCQELTATLTGHTQDQNERVEAEVEERFKVDVTVPRVTQFEAVKVQVEEQVTVDITGRTDSNTG